MSGKMRNLVGAAYYLVFFFIIGYIFANIAGVDLISSMRSVVSSAILFVQQIIGQLSGRFNIFVGLFSLQCM